MAGLSGHLHHCNNHSFSPSFISMLAIMLPFCPPMPFVFSQTLSLLPSYPMPTSLNSQLKVVKVVGVPPAYPPIPMANLPLPPLHTWLLPGISTYQVGYGRTAWFTIQIIISPTSLHRVGSGTQWWFIN